MGDPVLHCATDSDVLKYFDNLSTATQDQNEKVHLSKYVLWTEGVRWRGPLTFAVDPKFDPCRMSNLLSMVLPYAASTLQQFLCVMQRTRTAITEFIELITSLWVLLMSSEVSAGAFIKRATRRIQQSDHRWNALISMIVNAFLCNKCFVAPRSVWPFSSHCWCLESVLVRHCDINWALRQTETFS